jgi:hypothetical protein
MYDFKILEPEYIPWGRIEACEDHVVYKSQAWIEHLQRCYHVAPYVLEVYDADDLIGYFVGERFRKGVWIIAAGFEGWSTAYQGLSMLRPVTVNKRVDIYGELIEFLFRERQCTYFQAADWHLELPQVVLADLRYEVVAGYVLDISRCEEALLAGMRASTKSIIRKGKNSGVTNRIAGNVADFVDAHYDHLLAVFARQHLKPTKRKEEVREQICSMQKWHKSLLVEAVAHDGESLASGFFLHDNKIAFIVSGGNSTRALKMGVNEPLMFEAIRLLKQRGVTTLEFGGGRRFKEKYGPTPYVRPRIMACRFKVLFLIKRLAREGYYLARAMVAAFRAKTSIGTEMH